MERAGRSQLQADQPVPTVRGAPVSGTLACLLWTRHWRLAFVYEADDLLCAFFVCNIRARMFPVDCALMSALFVAEPPPLAPFSSSPLSACIIVQAQSPTPSINALMHTASELIHAPPQLLQDGMVSDTLAANTTYGLHSLLHTHP